MLLLGSKFSVLQADKPDTQVVDHAREPFGGFVLLQQVVGLGKRPYQMHRQMRRMLLQQMQEKTVQQQIAIGILRPLGEDGKDVGIKICR